ncbi:hypothetical protein JL722_8519 [Aureococcus anophagefferens]|nr:hypothetical protein JL722_8519 [Aureococcus anophagefferens]
MTRLGLRGSAAGPEVATPPVAAPQGQGRRPAAGVARDAAHGGDDGAAGAIGRRRAGLGRQAHHRLRCSTGCRRLGARSRVAATPPPLALPPPAERGESTSSGAASPAPDSDDDVGFARARDARGVQGVARLARAIRAALGAAGATKSSLDLALPLDDGTARDLCDGDRVAVEDGAPEDDDEDEEDEEEDDDDDDDDEARVLGGLGGSAEDDDDDDLDDDMDDLDDMDDPDGLDDDDESFAALAETLLARALLGRDKYAPKALMRAASMAAEGRVLPVVLVLAFEESVYVVLEARHDALLELSSPETLEACGPRGRSRSDSGADRDRRHRPECWTGGGFGHVEVMMQLPQPLRLACDRSLLHHALLQLPPADAADDCTPWLTLALLPGADDLVAVPLAGLYVRTAAAGGLGAFGGGLALGDDAGAPPPLAAALVGDGVSGPPPPGGGDDDEASARRA